MVYRNSKQRNAVLKVLGKKNYHPTVDEIYSVVKDDFPKISLATVYRNVEQLCQMGKIWKVEIADGPSRYDGNMDKHFHICCERCGEVADAAIDGNVAELIDPSGVADKFIVTGYRVEFYGICSRCRNSDAGSMEEIKIV